MTPRSTQDMVDRILRMGKQARSMVSQSKKAFEARDVELARDLVRQDDLIDNLNKECFALAVEVGDQKDVREWAMTMMLVARALERIGDNAVDIGEQVAFVVTGLFQRVRGRLAPRRDAGAGALASVAAGSERCRHGPPSEPGGSDPARAASGGPSSFALTNAYYIDIYK